MASRHYLMILEESSYGTPALSTGAPSSNRYSYIRLDQNNAFTMRPVGNRLELPRLDGYAGRGSRLVLPGGTFAGSLTTLLTYTQAKRLLDWATVQVNSGRTTPWVTTDSAGVMPENDLASCSIYEAIDKDGTIERKAYRGVKVAGFKLACSAQSPQAILTLDLVAQKVDPDSNFGGSDSTAPDATEFPEPAASDFPTDLVVFQDTSGQLSIASTRVLYESVDLSVTNAMDPYKGAAKFIQRLRFWGRSSATLAIKSILTSSPNDRTNYEANTSLDSSLAFVNGGLSITIDFNAANKIDAPPTDSLPNGNTFTQDAVLANYYDTSASGDLSIVVDNTA
jgi:hypothetical protein